MATFLKSLLAAAIGVALGLTATWLAVERGYGFGAVSSGPWTGWPKTGSDGADPYARAVLARTGEVPLGLAEGLSFTARTDEAGAKLDPTCDYIVTGPIPPARYWTLTALTPRGLVIDNGAGRTGITSAEIVRAMDGSFAITLSRQARAGNWLPLGNTSDFVLLLRLYDTPLSSASSSIGTTPMPTLRKERCA
ncbi:DUF1214 domain-containing protein [Methylocella sp. CPCC 101449]|uniref:DUF1214 domain-containing protein n=1 Tax=Methylocella sp. CPCC 101449 TaxID=2987531 RepID=UPI00288F4AAF|nr:DUF1214 domain-containing protein [Methylocella sp. CPCC 101449]MDT2024215.1 DUF1214 domain-containing protein [Methylocella sp. CPCC 101449]HEV2571274.1 DUF1214 domain-containing protein [Beijerinckiaceae bacterium]